MFELMSLECCKLFKVFGVNLELIEVVKGMKGVIVKVEEIVVSNLEKYLFF